MGGVLQGFFAIWSVVAVGWVLAHVGLLDSASQLVLSRLSFFAGSPALMVTMMSAADLRRIFATNLLVSIAATVLTGVTWLLVSRLVLPWRGSLGHLVIGTFGSCYVNAANMGLPIAAYVLHDVTWVAPVLLVQVAVLQPLGLALLDLDAQRRNGQPASWWHDLGTPLRNPMTLGVLAGLALNLTHTRIPALLLSPLQMLGALAVPTMLLAFGVSLRLGRLPGGGEQGRETWLVCLLKLVWQPTLALALARLAGLDRQTTLAVLVLAGLPTAQNVFSHAVRYQESVTLARDVVFITSIASVPTILAMSLALGI